MKTLKVQPIITHVWPGDPEHWIESVVTGEDGKQRFDCIGPFSEPQLKDVLCRDIANRLEKSARSGYDSMDAVSCGWERGMLPDDFDTEFYPLV